MTRDATRVIDSSGGPVAAVALPQNPAHLQPEKFNQSTNTSRKAYCVLAWAIVRDMLIRTHRWAAFFLAATALLLLACPPPPRSAESEGAAPAVVAADRAAPTPHAPPVSDLHVTAIDVGQGDAILIVVGEGAGRKVVLIDGGPPAGASALMAALRRAGVAAIDLLVITHAHLDHIGGLRRVLGELPVRAVLDSGVPHPTTTYQKLLSRIIALKEAGKLTYRVARRGQTVDLGPRTRLHVLAPSEPLVSGSRSDVNANSVVLRLDHGAVRLLLMGDAEAETEERLLPLGAELRADVLKVAHHGSAYASSPAFLARVAPRLALVSAGQENDYGHPTPSTLGRLVAAHMEVLRTDERGDVTLASDGTSVHVLAGQGTAQRAPRPASSQAGTRKRVHTPRPMATAATHFVASRRGRLFHHPECRGALSIVEGNRIDYATREDGERSGRRPHRCAAQGL